MKFEGEVKLVGDSYTSGFACGATMGNAGTMERFSLVSENDTETVYESPDKLRLVVKHEEENGAFTVTTSITNNGSETVTMEMLTSFLIRGLKVDKLHRMQSCWSAEGKLKSESITDLHMERSWNGCAYRIEKFGNVGTMPVRKWFPFMCVENAETSEFIAVQLYLASSWQMEMKMKGERTYTISGGIADRDFGHWTKSLAPGETFIAPKAVVAVGNTLLEACDRLVKAQKPAISENDSSMGIMFNEYCTTWGNPTFDNVRKVCDKIAGKGIDFLVIDSGWYGDAENWWDMVGDWYVNEKRFPGGMKPIADYIRSKNMIPGMWFEMESVTSGAVRKWDSPHLVKRDGLPLTVGGRRFWDMEDPEAIAYLKESVIDRLKECGFGYVKIDYNDTMGMGCDGPEGEGENLRKKVLGTQAFFKKMAEEIPGLVIENCSSGGHRLEPSMMELVSQASFSDAHETKAIPIIAANLHRVIKPSQSQIWAVVRAKDDENRLNYSLCATLLGRMCLSGDIYDLSEEQWRIVENGMAFYRKAADIIRDGSTTLISVNTESYNNPTGEQLVIRDLGKRKLLVFHRFENSRDLDTVLSENNIDLSEYRTTASFGSAECDFSSMACILLG